MCNLQAWCERLLCLVGLLFIRIHSIYAIERQKTDKAHTPMPLRKKSTKFGSEIKHDKHGNHI